MTDPTLAVVRAELLRESQSRARTYPDMVATGRMMQAEADYQRAIIAAMITDMDRIAACPPYSPPAHRFTWAERRAALRRELDYRARLYPKWISSGRITQTYATTQTAALAAALKLYDEGWDWEPANGICPRWGTVIATPEQEASRTEWRAHAATLFPEAIKQAEMIV